MLRPVWKGLALAGLLVVLVACGRAESTAPAASFATATAAPQSAEEVVVATNTPEPADAAAQPTETPETTAAQTTAQPAPSATQRAAAAPPAASPTLRPAPTNLPALVPTPEPPIVGPVPPELLQAIIADLTGRTGANPADVTVIQAEAVEWPDGSLGCPKPGEAYLQVITPGYKVVLELAGKQHDYRANERGFFFECVGR